MDRQIEFCSVLEGEGSMQTVRKKITACYCHQKEAIVL